ncbi:plasmid pRiA4b ORF-3 family protein [Paenibacillus doosanensis]|uniref:plasmid pRiA4b ORF-3 family protein n=1 Tax=Paenibacillus doosanensis TaxID=1229154 RepID=UPI0021808673|nr:plasmid pRiA4b ORF-3 family protein [Paenibacillus doosanensis]MCS7461205.1 plasmid pRiA4b ORF-3 family protein [Paenibacillus doosanensis]
MWAAPWGHQHMLEVLNTPDHPEREQFTGWIREGYDPEYFSCNEVNAALQNWKDKLIPKAFLQRPASPKSVKLTKPALNKHLKQLSNDQLIELVKACYGASKDMGKFLAVKILGDEALESMFHEYRKKVEQEFFPERGIGKLWLQEAGAAISEFERLTESVERTLELKLIYIEMGVSYTLTYGDIDERFYYSMASMYANVINMVNDDETGEWFDAYEERLEAIVLSTRGIGWGFYDKLADLHAQLQWV